LLVSLFYTRVNNKLRGTDDDAPTHGDDEAVYWLDTLNSKKDELYQDVTKQWRITYKKTAPNEPGTVATAGTTTLTGTSTNFLDYNEGDKITVSGETVRTIQAITSDTVLTVTVAFSNTASAKTFTRQIIIDDLFTEYNLHRSFLAPSDKIYILLSSGNKVYLSYTQPQEQDYVNREVHLTGENPQTLTFTDDIDSTEDIVGGELIVPGYYMPDDLTATTDVLPFTDPNWAVFAVAAEIAGNDIVYEDKEENLNTKANNLYTQMVRKNRRGTARNPRKTPYNVKRIRGTNTR
jgi:hypothetical protein